MINVRKRPKLLISIISFFLLSKIASLAKINIIIGSGTALFSGFNCIAPLIGAFGGGFAAFGLFGINVLLRLLLLGIAGFSCFTYYVPTLFAALYWAHDTAITRVAVPLLCIILFALHPVGFAALPYAFYWLIPIVLFFVPRRVPFFDALGSTFIAHAVGSVIWLYTVPMSSTMWLTLIPIVFIERILFSLGMTAAYYLFSWCMKKMRYAHVKFTKSILPQLY